MVFILSVKLQNWKRLCQLVHSVIKWSTFDRLYQVRTVQVAELCAISFGQRAIFHFVFQ